MVHVLEWNVMSCYVDTIMQLMQCKAIQKCVVQYDVYDLMQWNVMRCDAIIQSHATNQNL